MLSFKSFDILSFHQIDIHILFIYLFFVKEKSQTTTYVSTNIVHADI